MNLISLCQRYCSMAVARRACISGSHWQKSNSCSAPTNTSRSNPLSDPSISSLYFAINSCMAFSCCGLVCEIGISLTTYTTGGERSTVDHRRCGGAALGTIGRNCAGLCTVVRLTLRPNLTEQSHFCLYHQ